MQKKFMNQISHMLLISPEDAVNDFIVSLPFVLTASQKNAISDIKNSFLKSYPTKRLIQGDVGSGKL